MDLDVNPLLTSYLNFGQFESFNPHLSSKGNKNLVNRWIKIIVFLNALKLFVIVLTAWCGFPGIKMYLIEILIFDESQQKLFDVGFSVIFAGLFSGVSHWIGLNRKVSSLESFRFLLISNTKDRYRQGHLNQLDKRSTDKFLRVYRVAGQMLKLFTFAYCIFFLSMVLRCSYHSFYSLSLAYFLSFGLLFTAITFIAYLLAVLFITSNYILVIVVTVFLVLRAKAINKTVSRRFIGNSLASPSLPRRIRRQKALKILILLNGFCKQFMQISSVIDSCTSGVLLGIFVALFVIPFFLLFVQIQFSIRLFLSLLAAAAYCFCCSFSLCNDRLKRQVL